MSTRVFSALDATVVQFAVDPAGEIEDGLNQPPTNIAALSTILTATGPGSWSLTLNSNGSGDTPSSNAVCEAVAAPVFPLTTPLAITQRWTIDYTIVPAIPATARIKKLVFNRPRSCNVTFTANVQNDDTGRSFIFSEDILDTPIYFPVVDGVNFVSPSVVSETINGVTADEVVFDLTGGDTFKTRDELIADFSEFNNNLFRLVIGLSVFDTDELVVPTAALNGTVTFGLGWSVTVTYEEGFEWELSQDTSPVDEDSIVTVTSDPDDALPLDMEEIETIDIQFPDPDSPGDFITISVPEAGWVVTDENLITFPIPSFGVYEPPYFSILITSDQFSGSISLGMLFTIYFLSASGIYTLTFGQTHDTLYLEDDLPNTIDTKIPNPTIKTGYVDG